MADIEISAVAYSKIVLHTARYPHCTVNGVLLAEKQKDKESGNVNFVDCVPLFHLTLGLSPMLEVALNQVDAYCQENGLVIGGYYQANERQDDRGPDEIARKTACRIADHFSNACLFMINNENLMPYSDEDIFEVYQYKDSKWNRLEKGHKLESGSLEAASTLLHENAYRDLIDFDNHLDDITLDWRNQDVLAKTNSLL